MAIVILPIPGLPQVRPGDDLAAQLASAISVAKVGVKQGDLIEKVGTKSVTTVQEFEDAVKELSLKDGIVLHLRTAEGKRFVIVKDNADE